MGELLIDCSRHRVTLGGAVVQLTPNKFRLLCALAAHPEAVHSRQELGEQVWGTPAASVDRAIDAHICRLRTKLHAVGVPAPPIVSVRGLGYTIVAATAVAIPAGDQATVAAAPR